jgi:hypothetical protein
MAVHPGLVPETRTVRVIGETPAASHGAWVP